MSQQIKNAPATPLPWAGVISEPHFSEEDAAYVKHAANAYPKLVQALRKTLVRQNRLESLKAGIDLLRELGEDA